MNWSKPLPRAVLAALLTLLVAAPILGLRLQTPGLHLEVHLADALVWWLIGGAVALVFVWQLVRDNLTDRKSVV